MDEGFRRALDRAAGDRPDFDLTDEVWAQGRVVRRRRQTVQTVGGLAAAAVLVGAFWVGGGLLGDRDALPGPAETPADDPAATTVAVETTAPEETATEDIPEEETSPEEEPEPDEPTAPVAVDPCTTAHPDPVLLADGLPEASTASAEEVLRLAAECDLGGLAALAEQDQTFLSFGAVGPEEAFSGDGGAERAAAITALLTSFEPEQDVPDAPYAWPGTIETSQDWALLVDTGLYTQEQVELMSSSETGYTGWRVGVDADGQWSFMVAGD
ncbi:hypothetical protein [Serinicoccus sp. LYQ131]|uniref:hypothetical protein n=1 Tax=Serinicoccus sp. LYQ131 TaxID=3378797 RepID=UPI003853C410